MDDYGYWGYIIAAYITSFILLGSLGISSYRNYRNMRNQDKDHS